MDHRYDSCRALHITVHQRREETMSITHDSAPLPSIMRPVMNWPRMIDWFDSWLPGETNWWPSLAPGIRIEEFTRNGTFVIRAEIPGINPDTDVDIAVNEGVLTISGHRQQAHEDRQRSEFYYGSFTRSLRLPAGATAAGIRATYRDGILEVAVPVGSEAGTSEHIAVTRA